MRLIHGIAAALLLLPGSAAGVQEGTAALVLKVTGEVSVVRGAGSVPAEAGLALSAGDAVVPGTGGRAILMVPSGAQQIVAARTVIEAPSGPERSDLFARALSTLARAATAEARGAGGRQGMIRPIPGETFLVGPRSGSTLLSSRPAFSWTPTTGVERYTLQLRPVSGGRPMRHSIEGTSWIPDPEGTLAEGSEWAWTVAPEGGRPVREERFRIAEGAVRAEVETGIEAIRAAGFDPEGEGLLLMATLLRDLDLLPDAAASLRRLEAEGPLGVDALLLLGEVLQSVGDADGAEQAFGEADRKRASR